MQFVKNRSCSGVSTRVSLNYTHGILDASLFMWIELLRDS